MRRHWSVRTQLVILVLSIALPLAGVGVFSVVSQVRVVERRAQSRALNLAETTAANVRDFLGRTDQPLAGMIEDHELRTLDLDACQHVVDELRLLSADFANVFVAVNARPYCSAKPASDTLDATGSLWWEAVQQSDGLAIGEPQLGRISGQWITVAAYPIRDTDGRFVAALGAAVDMVRFERLLASAGLPPGAVITLQDADGIVVARSEDADEWVGRRLPGGGLEEEHRSHPTGQSRTPGAEGIDRLWA